MRAVIYTRVSTEEQANSGLGLEAQLTACQAKAVAIGATEVLHFQDAGVSGASQIADRAGLTAALASLRKGDVLLVAKRDRIARDTFVTLSVERAVSAKKATLLSTAGEGTGEEGVAGVMQRGMFDLFAQIEREMIRARTKSALQAKKARGERVGQIPFGYQLASDGVHLEPNQVQQEIMAVVISLRNSGLSYRAIASELNTRGAVTFSGKNWSAMQVQRIVMQAI